jgi:hypothetical protein
MFAVMAQPQLTCHVFEVVSGQRGLARPHRHQPQSAARRQIPGQPRLRQRAGATLRRDLIDVAAPTARHDRGEIRFVPAQRLARQTGE